MLNLHSPEQFLQIRERRFRRQLRTAAMQERYRDEFAASYPPTHRYNDIAGFAELYWDGGTRILVVYHFRGLRNRGFGDAVKAHWGESITPRGFYRLPYIEVGGIPNPKCDEGAKREAIVEALEQIRTAGEEWGFFLDATHEKALLQSLNIDLFFRRVTHKHKTRRTC